MVNIKKQFNIHISGKNRLQIEMSCLEDHITAENPVRVIDAFIDVLDLEKFGFVPLIGGIFERRPCMAGDSDARSTSALINGTPKDSADHVTWGLFQLCSSLVYNLHYDVFKQNCEFVIPDPEFHVAENLNGEASYL